MASYTYTFELHPPGLFGLEEPGKTVLPSAPEKREIEGDVVDTRTWRVVSRGHGTVTRDPSSRIDERFAVASCPCWLRDNFLHIEVSGCDLTDDEGWERAGIALRRFVLSLSSRVAEAVRAKLVQAVDDSGRRLKHVTVVKLTDVRVYGLDGLRADVRKASAEAALQDDMRLHEALTKLDLALTLDDAARSWLAESPRFSLGDPMSALAAERLLNYFKAVTAVLGDPSQESSRWQTFYRELGLDADADTFKALKRIRDDQDVAHVIRTGHQARVNAKQVDLARAAAMKVVRSYVDWLCARAQETDRG